VQVNCSNCSQPIALTDIIESHNGVLSHVDCKRHHVLTPEEWALVFLYCSGHAVARCPACDIGYQYKQLAANLFSGTRTNMCPRCRRDLTEAVRAHLFVCAMLPSEVRRRAQGVRLATQLLVKASQQLRDNADILIHDAEALLFERQRALREAMARGQV
jgi:hypothetical protein